MKRGEEFSREGAKSAKGQAKMGQSRMTTDEENSLVSYRDSQRFTEKNGREAPRCGARADGVDPPDRIYVFRRSHPFAPGLNPWG
jgi:hypothetical protein